MHGQPFANPKRHKARRSRKSLLLFLLITTLRTLRLLRPLPLDAPGAGTAVGGGEGEIDVLLRVEADDERGDVDDLLADADVSLADEDAGVVDRLGETGLEDLGLQPALEEVLDLCNRSNPTSVFCVQD